MSLSNDTARCLGDWYWVDVNLGADMHPTCIDCKRRTEKTLAPYQWWMQGVILNGKCGHKIKE